MEDTRPRRALEGIRVVDFLWLGAGAWGSRLLAAHGAEVIRVEWEGKHDVLRFYRPYLYPNDNRAVDEASPNRSGHWANLNPGKRGISLDLHSPQGKDALRRLIRISDVVADNYTATTLARWGFGYSQLRELRPDIIYVQSSGFGATGPYHDFRSFGPVAAAISGLTYMSGLPDRWPVGWGYSYLDVMSPWFVVAAILMSLRHRGRTGKGQHVDLSQSSPGFLLSGTALLDQQANGRAYRRTGNASPNRPAAPHNVYRCRPGENGVEEWIAIACFSEQDWQGLVAAMGDPEWSAAPEFGTLTGRLEHAEALDARIGAWTLGWERYALMDHLQRAGVPAGVCQTPADRVERDPQLAHRDFFVELNHSEVGPHRVENVPGKMRATPPHVGGLHDRGAPCYGEDNEFVFGDLLGLPSGAVAALAAARATSAVS